MLRTRPNRSMPCSFLLCHRQYPFDMDSIGYSMKGFICRVVHRTLVISNYGSFDELIKTVIPRTHHGLFQHSAQIMEHRTVCWYAGRVPTFVLVCSKQSKANLEVWRWCLSWVDFLRADRAEMANTRRHSMWPHFTPPKRTGAKSFLDWRHRCLPHRPTDHKAPSRKSWEQFVDVLYLEDYMISVIPKSSETRNN